MSKKNLDTRQTNRKYEYNKKEKAWSEQLLKPCLCALQTQALSSSRFYRNRWKPKNLLMRVKQYIKLIILNPFLGMVWIPPIKMVMTGGWCKWHRFTHIKHDRRWKTVLIESCPSSESDSGVWGDGTSQNAVDVVDPFFPILEVFLYSGMNWRTTCWKKSKHNLDRICSYMAVCQNPIPLVNIKVTGKWMFIPLKMVCIGIDP